MKSNTSLRRGVKRLAYAAALTLATIATAHAAYPERPVTLVVPYPPAGTTDLAARTMAQAMEAGLGQTIVVENRAGAGGSIGMGVVARAKPDGYTIGMGTIGTQTINQFLYTDMPFDPEKDFVPIALVVTTPNIIAVNAKSDIKNLADLIAKAKSSKDEKLTYATPGIGSSVHLTGAYLEQVAGIEMLHIPFKGVSGSLPALIGGQVDILLDNLPSTLAQVQDGSKIRGIAVTSAKRLASVPDIPTVAESGIADFDVTAWFALYAPKGTPKEAVDKLIAAAQGALASSELQAKFISLGAQAGTLVGDELAAFEAKERERWSKLIKDRNIQRQ
ncbi:ABC transporter substrate-binding protein [Pollutimonas subterranea]|uniref:ABC transporter substrate-binding protein n=1 Tax=Pollutimonas subterranea TaxID=2045210 RepID=A0A2N4U6Q5_9BURK|nr:tripartite tricarboxylate transporter substrate binding protein [Pollutimonas subterranea]PLC50705.1 ABC transporter substrate-binding protein [Pollutimonas subterranea]